jgi:hypothetical protein
MSDTFAFCGCQYEPDKEFQKQHWHEVRIDEQTTVTHCDLCDNDIGYQCVEYGVEP